MANKGWTYQSIAEALLLDEGTIRRHVNEYRNNKKLKLGSGGYDGKLNAMQIEELSKHLEQVTYLMVR